MRKILGICLGLSLLAAALLQRPVLAQEQPPDLSGFTPIFDGKTLAGWHKFGSGSIEPAGKWYVQDGAIFGDQDPPGHGGLLVTDKLYGDYELYGEVMCTWPLDSGYFLRILPSHQMYQITIDFRPTGEVGAVYGPGGFYQHNLQGFSYWDPSDFNPLRVRIEGQPPRVRIWIRDKLITDFQDTLIDGKPRFPEVKGSIGIQVHPGESWGPGSKVAFRKLMVKELN